MKNTIIAICFGLTTMSASLVSSIALAGAEVSPTENPKVLFGDEAKEKYEELEKKINVKTGEGETTTKEDGALKVEVGVQKIEGLPAGWTGYEEDATQIRCYKRNALQNVDAHHEDSSNDAAEVLYSYQCGASLEGLDSNAESK